MPDPKPEQIEQIPDDVLRYLGWGYARHPTDAVTDWIFSTGGHQRETLAQACYHWKQRAEAAEAQLTQARENFERHNGRGMLSVVERYRRAREVILGLLHAPVDRYDGFDVELRDLADREGVTDRVKAARDFLEGRTLDSRREP